LSTAVRGRAQVVEQTVADDDVVMIRGAANTRAVSVLLRGANDYLLDEMDRSLHDAFCIVKRVLESGVVVPGAPRGLAQARAAVSCPS
jgi:T-complex protein 1 subunit alpha